MLCAVHFPSKQHEDSIDQYSFTMDFASILSEAEQTTTHMRTILVGDLNMNPYEDSVVSTKGLHAVPTRTIAMRESRIVDRFPSNRYFYNPMWKHFGENLAGHAGTYYYSTPKARADYWNIYDQVLVRPNLLNNFRDEDVEILWQDMVDGSLLIDSKGQPKAKEISEHLPLLFRLNI